MVKKQIAYALAATMIAGAVYVATLPRPAAKSVAAERITQAVTVQALSGTALQMDMTESPLTARISAARLTDRGSAAYVLQKDRCRALGILLESPEEAESMRQRLAQSGIETEIYPCEGQALTLRVTADAAQLHALTSAIHAVDMAALQPGRIAQQMDAGDIDAAFARGLMAMLVSDLETAQNAFATAAPAGTHVDAFNHLMREAIAALQPLTEDALSDTLLTGRMRCAGMHVWFSREALIAQIQTP